MTRTTRFTARGMFGALLALSLTITDATSAPGAIGVPTINYWRDACEVAAHFDDPTEMQRVIDATVFIVHPDAMDGRNPDGSYRVRTRSFDVFDGMTLTSDSHFYGEQVILFNGIPGRSGFLVSPQHVVTSPHTEDWNLTGYYVLFGYENTPLPDGSCAPIDLTHFPASRVRVIGRYENGYPGLGDYLVARLTEPVLDRPFLRVRRNGRAELGDEITVVGHPARLSKKIDTAGRVVGFDGDRPLAHPVHSILFNSGSPLYNLSRQYVELAVMTHSCAVFRCDGPGSPASCTLESNCWAPSALNPEPIKTFAPLIDSLILETAPLSVLNIGTAAGGFAQAVTTYTLKAPSGSTYAAASIDYQIEPPVPIAGAPHLDLLTAVPLTGMLTAGATLSFDVEAVMPPGQTCGIFEREFLVHDLTHGYTDRVHQTLEVGQIKFEADRAPLSMEGIEQPYTATRTLQIRNLRPTPAPLSISADQTWVRIDGNVGVGGSPAQVLMTLAAHQSATITIGMAPAAGALPLYVNHEATVTVASTNPSCSLTAPLTVPVHFTPGLLHLRQTIDASVPAAPTSGPSSPLTASIEVGESFCVDEVKASYVFDHAPDTFKTNVWLTESAWDLQRPDSSAWMPLWQLDSPPLCAPPTGVAEEAWCYLYRGAKSACEFGTAGDTGEPCDTVAVGDAPRPSLGDACEPGGDCEPFEGLTGKSSQGIWTMRLSDRVSAGLSSQPHIRGWTLQFRGSAACTK